MIYDVGCDVIMFSAECCKDSMGKLNPALGVALSLLTALSLEHCQCGRRPTLFI